MIDSARWQKVQELFEAALSAGPEAHQRILDASGADAETRETVVRMLRADATHNSVLDRCVPELAYDLLLDADADKSLPPMEEFGPYRPIRMLGEGGMGVVWLARRTDTDALVAVKFLPNAGLSPARLERFAQEVRLLSKLKHPCIARLYDAGTLSDGTPWFVMEYVEGTAFGAYANALKTVDGKLRLFRRVCEAVQYAHSQEIIHRDLKPSNILVESDGTPKLLDFGIARELQPAADQPSLTVRGPRFMSPYYSAPEWIKEAAVGFTTDVYSLGVILNEMLTGRAPLPGQNERARHTTRPSLNAASADLKLGKSAWKDLDVLCLKAMHPDPAQRYVSVEALVRDLDHFLRNEPLEARPDTWSYSASKFIRRNRRAVAVSAAASVLIVAMAVGFTWRLAVARNAALAEAARSNRVQQFTLSLFEGSGNLADSPGNLTVEMLVDRGVTDAERLSEQPRLQADLYQTLGRMYRDIGNPVKADRVFSRALALADRLPDSTVAARVVARMNLAGARSNENELASAEALMREAVQIAAADAPEDKLLLSRANFALGSLFTTEGQYAKSAAMLKSVADEQTQLNAPQADIALTLIALSNAELGLGHYDESDAVNKQLLALYSGGGNNPRMADALQNLGDNAEVRGHYDDAERYARQAVSVEQAWYGAEHRTTANKMSSLGTALVDQGKLVEADSLLRHALIIELKAYTPTNISVAKTLRTQGMLETAQGNYRAAIETFDKVIEIYREHYKGDSYLLGVALLHQGAAYTGMKQYAQGERRLRESLRILRKMRGEDDVYTARAQLALGHVLQLEGHNAEAQQHTQAGIDTLKKVSPSSSVFLNAAAQDLAAEQEQPSTR